MGRALYTVENTRIGETSDLKIVDPVLPEPDREGITLWAEQKFDPDSDEFFADAVTEWGVPAVKDGHSVPPLTGSGEPLSSPSSLGPPQSSNSEWQAGFHETRNRLSQLLASAAAFEMLHHIPASYADSTSPAPVSTNSSISPTEEMSPLHGPEGLYTPSNHSTPRINTIHLPANVELRS